MLAQAEIDGVSLNPWDFEFHPEVWVLVGFLTGAYVYMVRVIGPNAVPEGSPVVSTKNKVAFVFAMLTLWIASDWPMHDISEEYLYSAHMLQHMMLSFFLPPLALLATPTWLARVLLGTGGLYRAVRWLTHPVVAGVSFNVIIMVTHIPIMVNWSVQNGPLHYTLHFLVVIFALLMWTPVCGPIPEFQIGPLPKCIYLFLQSIVPTIPAAWLTFAEGVVYSEYDVPVRVFGWSVEVDQQLAGAVMKLAGGIFLWGIVITIYIRHVARDYTADQDYRRLPGTRFPDAEVSHADDDPITTADVEEAFASSRAPVEPDRADRS